MASLTNVENKVLSEVKVFIPQTLVKNLPSSECSVTIKVGDGDCVATGTLKQILVLEQQLRDLQVDRTSQRHKQQTRSDRTSHAKEAKQYYPAKPKTEDNVYGDSEKEPKPYYPANRKQKETVRRRMEIVDNKLEHLPAFTNTGMIVVSFHFDTGGWEDNQYDSMPEVYPSVTYTLPHTDLAKQCISVLQTVFNLGLLFQLTESPSEGFEMSPVVQELETLHCLKSRETGNRSRCEALITRLKVAAESLLEDSYENK